MTRRRAPGRKRTRRKPGRRVLGAVLWAAAGLGAAWLGWKAWTWPDVSALARADPPTTAFIEMWRGRERALGRPGRPAWTRVRYEAISPHLKRAVLVAEDINFFSHRGFEVREMRNAIARALEDGEPPRGASTITQQLAKNLWLSPSRHPIRKIEEALLTWQLERTLDKRRILELYLNVVEFGPGVYGAEAASRRYFEKGASDLTEDEAARLAAALPRPSDWNPAAGSRRAERRTATILRRMGNARFLWKEI